MIAVEFFYNNNATIYEADLYSPFQYVFDVFTQHNLLDRNSIYFTFNGEIIDPNQTIINKIQKINMQINKIPILVHSKYDNSNNYQMYNSSQNNYPSYEQLNGNPNNSLNNSNTISSVSSINDTSYQSVNSYNPPPTPYNSKLNEFTIIYKIIKKDEH